MADGRGRAACAGHMGRHAKYPAENNDNQSFRRIRFVCSIRWLNQFLPCRIAIWRGLQCTQYTGHLTVIISELFNGLAFGRRSNGRPRNGQQSMTHRGRKQRTKKCQSAGIILLVTGGTNEKSLGNDDAKLELCAGNERSAAVLGIGKRIEHGMTSAFSFITAAVRQNPTKRQYIAPNGVRTWTESERDSERCTESDGTMFTKG